jgi:hypothetical protein
LNAERIDFLEHLFVDYVTSIAVPLLEDLLDSKVSEFILSQSDDVLTYLLQETLSLVLLVSLGNYFLDDTEAMLVYCQFIKLLVDFFEDKVLLI